MRRTWGEPYRKPGLYRDWRSLVLDLLVPLGLILVVAYSVVELVSRGDTIQSSRERTPVTATESE